MEESTDSEEEIYYSLDSSPQDDEVDRIPNGTGGRFANSTMRRQSCMSDPVYSDFSSSRETIGKQQQAHVTNREGAVGGRYPIRDADYSEDETPDSPRSSEFAGHMGSKRGDISSRVNCPFESYSSVPLHTNVLANDEKEPHGRRLPSDVVPSAPPYCGSPFWEINQDVNSQPQFDLEKALMMNQDVNKIPASRQHSSEANGSSIRNSSKNISCGLGVHDYASSKLPDQNISRTTAGTEAVVSLGSPVRLPTFHASGQGTWDSVLAYDACVRLCHDSCARGCTEEASIFLKNDCALLRNAFGLQEMLLQSEKELPAKRSTELVSEGAVPKPKKTIGKMKVQVRRVKMSLDMPPGCSSARIVPRLPANSCFSQHNLAHVHASTQYIKQVSRVLKIGMNSLRNSLVQVCRMKMSLDMPPGCSSTRIVPRLPANSCFSQHNLAHVHASTQYIKQVSKLLKIGVNSLRNSLVQETYLCSLRLKSSTEADTVKMQSGSGETHVFFPNGLGDDLIIDVHDSKKFCGRVLAQVATIAKDPGDKRRWWSIYSEPKNELVGQLQLYVDYTTCRNEIGSLKSGYAAETVAYDLVLEVAMKVQHFHQRNLLLYGPWKWLVMEFASCYGVSDAYTKLRYLSYVMDVATPTADCLNLVFNFLSPVIPKSRRKSALSHQEICILGEIEEPIEQILALVFENYKSLDESSPSGMLEVLRPAAGSPAPALVPAIKLYSLLHDVLSPEAQLKLCSYFQDAAKKRSRRHLLETNAFVATSSEGALTDPDALSHAYQKTRELCLNFRNEVYTDIKIHDQHVLPSFIDLPNISASIYSVELSNRLRAFLVACPPTGPSPLVTGLVVATADFQRDLDSWNICAVEGGVDAKELFHLYIIHWIKDKQLALLEYCKLNKVKWPGGRHFTTPFVDDMYDQLRDTLNQYEIILCHWPEYTFDLEKAIVDIEKAVLEALDKQYADVLAPLKDTRTPKKFVRNIVQKICGCVGNSGPHVVPKELAILLNTMKRLLDKLRPQIELQLKSWRSCIPDDGTISGERLSDVTVMLKAKFINYLQAVVGKLAENIRSASATKIQTIIQDSEETAELDIRNIMQPFKDQLIKTIDHLHSVLETHIFIEVCRRFWDHLGQDVLSSLEYGKENLSWYRRSRVVVDVLDATFASQMQQLLGNLLRVEDLEPPRSIKEVRSMVCKDAPNHQDSSY